MVTAGRSAAAVLALSAVAALALPAAQGAAPRIKLFSCVNTLFGNEPAALNRCQDGRRLRYDQVTVTDAAIYTSDEREALESWPVTLDGRIARGSCYVGYRNDLGCEVVPGNSFQPREATIAPDGRQLYVSNFGEGMTIFDVGPAGALRFSGCVGSVGFPHACSEQVPGTDGGPFMAFDLAVSSDGSRVYVTDYRGVQTFRRLSGGGLEYVGCLKLARSTCASTQNRPFVAENAEIAMSGDSRFVYVMGGGGGADIKVKGQPVEILSVLERTDGSPGLRLVQELKMPVWGTDRGSGEGASIAIPGDGRHVYVTDRNRLATLARNAASGKVRLHG
jgi:DNA-binding beta-propeller fold protein YncE